MEYIWNSFGKAKLACFILFSFSFHLIVSLLFFMESPKGTRAGLLSKCMLDFWKCQTLFRVVVPYYIPTSNFLMIAL